MPEQALCKGMEKAVKGEAAAVEWNHGSSFDMGIG